MKINIIIFAIAPVIACLLWIYLKDKYDKEPIRILIKYFVLGVISSIFGIIIERYLMKINITNSLDLALYTSFIVAGLTEESLKAIILIPNLLKEKYFTEKLDGIIYSVFLSLGFATVENLIYILYESDALVLQVSLSRAVIAIPAHIMFAITMGYYISKYKFEKYKFKKREYLIMAVLVPILLHGIFDFILMLRYRWAIIIFVVYIVFLWKTNLDKLDNYALISKFRFLKYIRNREKKRKL
ncbi:MAG: PrsW family intramembrane metalloprotease [Peptostreptococcaceae bacterium]